MTSTNEVLLLDYPDELRDPHVVRENVIEGARKARLQVPARYENAEVTEPQIREWVRDLVAGTMRNRNRAPVVRTGPSLLLLGSTGTGKTHQAYGAINALAVSGVACRWVVACAADIYADLRPNGRGEGGAAFWRYASSPVLVIDDLGATKASEWTEEINFRLLNHRYEQGLATIVVSNVSPQQLSVSFGDRVASRLAGFGRKVVLTGNDRRRP